MNRVPGWRPGTPFSDGAVMALLREVRRSQLPPKEAVEYLRAALREADKFGDTESVRQILPFLAIMCQVTGRLAEAVRLNRRRRRIDPGPDSLEFLIVVLAFKGFARAALRVQRQAMVLGLPDLRRERALLAAVERSLLPVGSLLAIYHDGTHTRPRTPMTEGTTLIVEERGLQKRTSDPYTIRWTGEGNDLLSARRWRLDVQCAGDPVAFLDLTRRLAHRMNGVIYDPKNKILRASASRFFVPVAASSSETPTK